MAKKIVSLGIALIMVFSLGACDRTEPSPCETRPQICPQLENHIIESFVDYFNAQSGGSFSVNGTLAFRYYGTFNGNPVVLIRLMVPGITFSSETIAGITFTYPDRFQIRVFYNHNFYRLQRALDQGLLTVEDIEVIRCRHF